HVSLDTDSGGRYPVQRGPRTDRRRDGSRHFDPHVPGGGPWTYSALAASVSLAHGVCAPTYRCGAAYRRGDREDARTAASGYAGVYRRRPALRQWRGRGTKSLPHGGFP